jgi:UTP--glucose-1-phosphate uridylyltransferase
MTKAVRKAVIPVAGMGTRFLPATKSIPKEMLPVVDKPLIQYVIEEGLAAGIEEFILITSRGKHEIEDHFDHFAELEDQLKKKGKTALLELAESPILPAGAISAIRQQAPLGLGHAVWCARYAVAGEPFAVLLPDVLIKGRVSCLKQMTDAYADVGGNIIAVVDVPREHTNRYGILDPGAEKGNLIEVKGLVEKPDPAKAPSTLSIVGRYILDSAIFEELEKQEPGAGGEIQLTDSMQRLIGRQPFHGLRYEGTDYDCGDKLGFLKATVAYAMDRPDLAPGFKEFLKTVL